jgi:hypothetical protein
VTGDFVTAYSGLARRWGWRFVPAAVVFWTVLWPLACVWFAISTVVRHRSRDNSPAARLERRVARLVSWYPAAWTTRHGDEFAELLRETIRDGRDGPRMTMNILRESSAARIASVGGLVPATCWWVCWIPLFGQGVAPLMMKLAGSPTRSWFAALYLPSAYQWPAIAAMIALGLATLGTAARATRTASA